MSAPEALFCDWNAGAPVEPAVLERFLTVERDCPANPASVHAPGRRARAAIEDARARIATALGVTPDDVVFTSGGTEAANMAVAGLGDPTRPVLLAAVEHPAVLEPARQRGIVEWAVDESGAAFVVSTDASVGLVSLVHAQGELGTLQPVAAAARVATSAEVPLFVDAAQSLGRVAVDEVLRLADAVALSPHKCGGLRGHGVLIARGRAAGVRPLLHGGGQERGVRPGTQSPALAAANALAIELAVAERERRSAAMQRARERFLRGLRASGADCRVLTPLANSVPNTLMVAFADVDGRNLLPMLDLAGVHASHGSACTSGSPAPPPLLRKLGLDEDSARACVRFSFGWHDDRCDIEAFGRRAGEVVGRHRKKN